MFSNTLIIGQPDSMLLSISIIHTSCYGINDGALTANVLSGGSPKYRYSFGSSGYSSTGIFTGLSAGIDTLFIQDSLVVSNPIFEVLQLTL